MFRLIRTIRVFRTLRRPCTDFCVKLRLLNNLWLRTFGLFLLLHSLFLFLGWLSLLLLLLIGLFRVIILPILKPLDELFKGLNKVFVKLELVVIHLFGEVQV